MRIITREQVDKALDWPRLIAAMEDGHRRAKARIGDLHMDHGGNDLLNRAAWIPGLGIGLKTVTIFADNPRRDPPLPSVQGIFVLFDESDGAVRALIDGVAITAWKTAGDSALGSKLLSRTDSRSMLMVGAGAMAAPLIRAHASVRPGLDRIAVWNRSVDKARDLAAALADELAAQGISVVATLDLEAETRQADIICSATTSRQPVIPGAWLKPGAHLDLVGAFTADARETDDEALRRGTLFVDSRDTTMALIGELKIPLTSGAITETDVRGDLYDLVPAGGGRDTDDEITVFKNGGGAHLDLMTAIAIHQRCP